MECDFLSDLSYPRFLFSVYGNVLSFIRTCYSVVSYIVFCFVHCVGLVVSTCK